MIWWKVHFYVWLKFLFFSYIGEECPCYAGLDEQLFYNAKYEMIPDDGAYSTFTGKNQHKFSVVGNNIELTDFKSILTK